MRLKVNKLLLACLYYLLLSMFGLSKAFADNQCPDQIRGINLAGAEFGENGLPGVSAKYFKFPTEAQLKYYSLAGFNAVRLPIGWEKIQPALFGDLDKTYSTNLLTFMDQAQKYHQRVVIDIHNYARYRDRLLGSSDVPASAFYDLWKKLASIVHNHPALYAYSLMNEPHDTQNLWHEAAQYGINAIRTIDKLHLIYVDGDEWSGAASWPKANPRPFVSDPFNKVVYDAHSYFDDDFSGRYKKMGENVNFKDRINARLQPFIFWLKTNKQKGVIGEWSLPANDPKFNNAVDSFIDITNAECLDWFIWAGGQWKADYELSLEPVNGQDKVLLKKLKEYLHPAHK